MMLLGTETVCGSEDISGNSSLLDTALLGLGLSSLMPGVDQSSTTVVLVLLLLLGLHDHYQS